MKVANEALTVMPNRAMEIATLYHKQSLALINLALSHNKIAIESSHQRALELLEVKDPKTVHQLVSSHMVNQVKDYLLSVQGLPTKGSRAVVAQNHPANGVAIAVEMLC